MQHADKKMGRLGPAVPTKPTVPTKPAVPTNTNLEHENRLWKEGISPVAGVDEAGRGPLAGPVVAAAVILPRQFTLGEINDSKQLTSTQREALYNRLTTNSEVIWAIGICSHKEIDRWNILGATHEAMIRALTDLKIAPAHILVDGLPVRRFTIPQTALVGGDAISGSIAAASIIAKVTRDRMMCEFDQQFPNYGFANHKGYATPEHLEKLQAHGPSPIHRLSFEPVAQTTFSF